MAKVKLAKQIETAGAKVQNAIGSSSRAASPGAFLMTIFKSMILPALPMILSELLKSANAKTKKYLVIARDILVDANLDADE